MKKSQCNVEIFLFCVIINTHNEINIMSIRALQDYTFYAKYAKYNKDKKRRETWQETVDRVFEMHEHKFKDILEKNEDFRKDFYFAKEQVLKKRILGSQRALQFGGDPILKKNAKLYNCASTYIDRPRVFQEILWMLLNGCGVGFSVQYHHINKLPNIQNRNSNIVTHIIDDTIEGWSEALGALVNSYFNGGDNIVFDYSKIRPEGSPISGGFKAPGSKGLKTSLEKIQLIFEYRLSINEYRLRSIDSYDIIMHASDAVLSGGVRRSATICLFSIDDYEMLKSKTGDWYIKNPQRARSNNSVVLMRGKVSREKFYEIMKSVKEFGEPGFAWLDNEDIVYNPCLTGDTWVTTDKGPQTINDIINTSENQTDKTINILQDGKFYKTTNRGFWQTGIKSPLSITLKNGMNIKATPNHQFIINNEWMEVGDAKIGDFIQLSDNENTTSWDGIGGNIKEGWLIGNLIGDGTLTPKNECKWSYWGDEQQEMWDNCKQYLKDLSIGKNSTLTIPRIHPTNKNVSVFSNGFFDIIQKWGIKRGSKTFNKQIESSSYEFYQGVIGGFFDADGCFWGNSRMGVNAEFSQNNLECLQILQRMLSRMGIVSKINHSNKHQTHSLLPDGKGGNKLYPYGPQYSLRISGRYMVERFIGIIHIKSPTKLNKIQNILNQYKKNYYISKNLFVSPIVKIEVLPEEIVYDCTVPETACFDANGIVSHNCFEVGMYPKHYITGESGWQVCNLTEINAKKVKSLEDFLQASRAAAILGTMQASYTDFSYLGSISEDIIKRESLLGVSMTGMMDSPEIIFNAENQKQAAKEVLKTNEKIANILGINLSARTTVLKPSGSTSCILGTSSGVHPHHAKRYFRRVQANRNEFPLQHFKTINPNAVEKSVWSANDTDYVVSFLCEVPPGSIIKNQLAAIELLEKVKLTQQNWIEYGTRPELCVNKSSRHNVSNTITVFPNEWDDVSKYIYDNQNYFAGISLLPASGDKDYPQAPFCSVPSITEYNSQYGEAGLFASGLIVDGLKAFNDNLWAACDAIVGIGEKLEEIDEPIEPKQPKKNGYTDKEYIKKLKEHTINFYTYLEEYEKYEIVKLKLDWIRRARQFADRYFNGVNSIKQMTYCLKDCHNIKLWNDLSREYKDIDWSNVIESEHSVNIDSLGAQSCSGGKCELS